MSKIVISLLAFGMMVLLNASSFSLDPSHSHVGFSVKHMMISNVKGEFKEYDGVINFDPKSMSFTKFSGTVDAASVDTGIEKRDDHLKSADFFDVKKYPTITFVMKKYKSEGKDEGEMIGDLTIHGVTKSVKMDVEIGGVAKDPWGNTRLGFSLEGKINREDFGLKWNKVMEAGGLVVGDTIKLNIDIEAIEQ